jgi:transcriptional regulator with XRE-family HTH domain
MTEETLAMRLKRLRERAGLSQPQLAQRAGVPLSTLRGWEQGRREPSLGAAAKLARAMGITLDELAGLSRSDPPPPDHPQQPPPA